MAPGSKDTKPAGDYAQRRYQRGLRSWRANNRWLFVAFFGPLIIAGFVLFMFDRHLMSWLAGAVDGAGLACWIALRDEPPAYIQHWQQGAEGERKTAKALKPLQRSGLHVFHDIQARCGNYDHIAVGPAGVFLLETKNPYGIIEMRHGTPYLMRRHDPDAETPIERVHSRVLSAAAQLNQDIERRTGLRLWVQAVVVFWADFPEGIAEHDRCVYVHGKKLRAWLTSRPSKISDEAAEQIATVITWPLSVGNERTQRCRRL